MSKEEAYQDALRVATEVVRARILRDRELAPEGLKKVFTVIADRWLDPPGALEVWEAAGVTDRVLISVFAACMEVTLKQYLEDRRIEVAEILMALTALDLLSISEQVGYTNYPTFSAAYQRKKGKLPSAASRERLPAALIDDVTSLKAGWGLLDEDEFIQYIEDLRQIYPALANEIQIDPNPDPDPDPDPDPLIIFDGADGVRLKAEGLWQRIHDLPFDEQCRQVRGVLFRSEVLFDLLRKKSRLEGRKSRERGIDVAKLALVSLERSDEVFGERIYDLRALGWAWVANAIVLALDLPAAAEAFERTDRQWAMPRANQDLVILAHICNLKGTLWMMRREYAAATRDLDRSCSLFRQLGQAPDEALALINRAMIHGYAGKLVEAVEDLREAADLIDEDEEKELAFAVRANLSNAFVRDKEAGCAAKELAQARCLSRHIDDPLGSIKLDWIEGDLAELCGDFEEAKRFYTDVRRRFADRGESRYLGMVSVDLMTIHSRLEEWPPVEHLAVETLPLLASMQLHRESLAAVRVLAEGADDGCLSRRLLNALRIALRKDPLAM